MTPAQTVPAALLWLDATGELANYATRTDPTMLSPVDDAVDALRAGKPAMVAAGDVDAVIAALEAERVTA